MLNLIINLSLFMFIILLHSCLVFIAGSLPSPDSVHPALRPPAARRPHRTACRRAGLRPPLVELASSLSGSPMSSPSLAHPRHSAPGPLALPRRHLAPRHSPYRHLLEYEVA
jgi:hypothetical protein